MIFLGLLISLLSLVNVLRRVLFLLYFFSKFKKYLHFFRLDRARLNCTRLCNVDVQLVVFYILLVGILAILSFLFGVIVAFGSTNYLITESEVVTGKSRTEALPY